MAIGPIILMGLRGSGKTTAGRELARRMGRAFVDLDDRTAGVLGCASAGEAFRTHGEATFREGEVQALLDVLRDTSAGGTPQGLVLALGGGTPTAPEGPAVLRFARERCGARLIYLHAKADVLRARLAKTDIASRPSLTGKNSLEEISHVYTARDAVYRALADAVVESEGPAEELAGAVAKIAG